MKFIKPIKHYPDAILREVCKPVTRMTDAMKELALFLIDTTISNKGVGLAAPQIGSPVRMILVMYNFGQHNARPVLMINPKIIKHSQITEVWEEGCLSLPDVKPVPINRYQWVRVEYTDYNGNTIITTEDGLTAACIQHEIDHLDGKLIIDYQHNDQ